jgi:MFS family permease
MTWLIVSGWHLLGRRRILVAGTALFGASSPAGGLAGSAGVLVGARLAQGVGAAMMLPAGGNREPASPAC